ncbi:mitochondrial carrier [Neoconidiobolus thromboides FSU 785]|nr:mitochondrial carrier [Neoconidiobolus thromboides FSU 785]
MSGGIAGTMVDTMLFPLDTIKTRLQSQLGFTASGGFKNVYKGLSSAIIGSAPSAALFFCSYDTLKTYFKQSQQIESLPLIHMLAASTGEVTACLVRVPTEVIKQRLQTNQYTTYLHAVKSILKEESILGFYKGYSTTVLREIPFTCIQFPIYELLKVQLNYQLGNKTEDIPVWCSAIAGSISGGFAAAVTTPIDLAKTRIMLSSKNRINTSQQYHSGILKTLLRVRKEEGISGLFKGIVPRVLWLSLGGSIFLGSYEACLKLF